MRGSVLVFATRGLPDVLRAGDWHHPGPLYFYLEAPFYLASGQRAPSLSLFAFVVAYASAVGLSLLAYRLYGVVWASATASLVGVYALVAAPYLIANEWNRFFRSCRSRLPLCSRRQLRSKGPRVRRELRDARAP